MVRSEYLYSWCLENGMPKEQAKIVRDEVAQLKKKFERARSILYAMHRYDDRYYLVNRKIIEDLQDALEA